MQPSQDQNGGAMIFATGFARAGLQTSLSMTRRFCLTMRIRAGWNFREGQDCGSLRLYWFVEHHHLRDEGFHVAYVR